MERLRLRAATEAGNDSTTLSFYTDTCKRLWHELDVGCAPPTRVAHGAAMMAHVQGDAPWTREQLCSPPTQSAAEMWSGSTREVKLVQRLRQRRGAHTFDAQGASVYVTNHKVGTEAIGQQGSRVLKLNGTCTTTGVGVDNAASLAGAQTWWSVVRNPISRFVSAFNTVLTLTKVQRHYNCSNAAVKARFHRLYVIGMMRGSGGSGGVPRPASPLAFRYDMHTASQASELACMQREPEAETEAGVPRSGVRRLRIITRLEEVGLRNGTIDAVLLPGLSMHQTHQGMGLNDACAMSQDDLTPALVQLLCRYYAQDFVCFGYQLPSECAETDKRV